MRAERGRRGRVRAVPRRLRNFTPMIVRVPPFSLRTGLGLLLALVLPACQPQPRLEQLEAAQQQQARELTRLKQTLAERDEEIARLEDCVDDLESAVYEDDSTDYDNGPQLTQL